MGTKERLDSLAEDIRTAYGLTLTFQDVATVAKCSTTTARRAFWRGELVGSRFAKGGPVRFTARSVAEWLLQGENRALA